jgi:hypothetical protein
LSIKPAFPTSSLSGEESHCQVSSMSGLTQDRMVTCKFKIHVSPNIHTTYRATTGPSATLNKACDSQLSPFHLRERFFLEALSEPLCFLPPAPMNMCPAPVPAATIPLFVKQKHITNGGDIVVPSSWGTAITDQSAANSDETATMSH